MSRRHQRKTKKPLLTIVVIVFVLYGASIGKTVAEIYQSDQVGESWREFANVMPVDLSIPCILVGILAGIGLGVVIQQKFEDLDPLWVLPLAISLVLLWRFNILLFPFPLPI